MPKGVLVVPTICTDPQRDEEFNRWYSHTHIPDLSKATGFVRATRYRDYSGAKPQRYLCIYEFDAPDLEEAFDDLRRLAIQAYYDQRHIDCLDRSDQGAGRWEQLEPSRFKPLEKLAYSTTALPHIIGPMEADLRRKGKLRS